MSKRAEDGGVSSLGKFGGANNDIGDGEDWCFSSVVMVFIISFQNL